MRLFIRRRRGQEPSRREVHNQSRQNPRNPREQKGIQWFSIPLSLGVGVVGMVHLYKSYRTSSSPDKEEERERISRGEEKNERKEMLDEDGTRRPKRRPRIRPDGPW